jgi:AcrR family transcriptional regulator/DNA-binding MarR family transcriptional regulator
MAEAMAARGAGGAGVTLAEVITRAELSETAFYEAFADREACLRAAFEEGVSRARKRMLVAYDAERNWLDAIKAALAAFLRFLEGEPALGRVLVVYSMSGSGQLVRRRVEVQRELAAAVHRGRLEGPIGGHQTAAVISEGVVGGVLAILQNRLLSDERGELIELFGPLLSIIVLPYLGVAVARRELVRPAPRPRIAADIGPHSSVARNDTSDVRLTERTLLVLGAIADYPGASNREVADRAGILDQGQISKLLARLQARSLIAKMDEGRMRGVANAWQLTNRGEALLRSARAGSPAAGGPLLRSTSSSRA